MELDKELWHVRWFFWSANVIAAFANHSYFIRDARYYAKEGTTLCQFMRVTLVWCPLVILIHLIAYGALVYGCLILPIQLFGWSVALLLGGAGFMYLIFLYGARILDGVIGPRFAIFRDRLMVWRAQRYEGKRTNGPTFLDLVRMQAIAYKKRICPVIRFVSREKRHA